jgi:hypothetical protein
MAPTMSIQAVQIIAGKIHLFRVPREGGPGVDGVAGAAAFFSPATVMSSLHATFVKAFTKSVKRSPYRPPLEAK